ncbi:hypothetical protein [Pseudoduganella sp. RAF53_2]|uniref:hypothetical protein n=1 Tax=unclassified Pseudoduganella TaxID=2637179 RepID=UPI003F9E9503
MPNNNETRGRPSLLSAEQQKELDQRSGQSARPSQAASGSGRKWTIGVAALMLVAAVCVAFIVTGETAEPGPVAAAPAAAAPVLAAVTAPTPEPAAVAAILDEATPAPPATPGPAKPAESLAQMLEGTRAAPHASAKPKARPMQVRAKTSTAPQAEPDSDVELLSALVAHSKGPTSVDARLPLVKALEQCKRQDKRDAARCRLRVCDARWKSDECRVYSRSKLERSAAA